ncbi:sugar porter family MFS transporter [Affinibrenneria salicis]|uniref:Sugar porter family MFS transporter n=1 Tax=Affinibrenneria salicis TaxID=2590031 RepID=A0A5J5G215_9GAMM|nr:sugar porter family MFS transporter [Affinibrenneria salicis]KAA9000665.1 sugar porter family MFS transporter [Affinibrenneria salicis]
MPELNDKNSNYNDTANAVPADNEKISDADSSENNGFLSADAFLLTATAIAAIAGFLYGYDTGIISGALLQITRDFSLSSHEQELVTSAILVGAVVGALSCGKLSGVLGRRYTVMIVAAIFALGVIGSGLSPDALSLGLARLVLGFAVGGASQIVPVYIAELAPPEKRGRLVTFFNISIGIGILTAALVGTFLQDIWTWRVMFSVAAIPAVVLLFGMLPLPESPRWLVGKKRLKEAHIALDTVRETGHEVRREIKAIQRVHEKAERKSTGSWKDLKQPWLRPALVVGLGIAAFTQLSGIEMMIYYTPTFLTDAGFSRDTALHSALGVAVIYLLLTITGKLLVDHIGRRRLTLIMMPGAVISLLLLGLMFRLDASGGQHGWLIVACLFAFMVFNSGGIQVIGWLIGSEVYPLGVREKASSLHAATLWGSNLLLTATALSMVNLLGIGGAMWFYALLNLLGFLFIFFMMPETRGRSLEEIETSLKEGNFYPRRRHAQRSLTSGGND